MWRWQAAIFRRTAFGQASDLWWLTPRGRSRALRIGAVQVFPAMEGAVELGVVGTHPRRHWVERRAYLTPPLLPGVLAGTHDPLEAAGLRGWRDVLGFPWVLLGFVLGFRGVAEAGFLGFTGRRP
jgi:hypothetical protein